MPDLSSNHLKAIIAPTNLCETENRIFRDSCATIQAYHYECLRTRGNLSLPYGNIHSTVIEISLRNFSETLAKPFLKALKSSEPDEVSLIFNATFNDNGQLQDYDDAFVARGYVVEARENFSSDTKQDSQRSLFIRMLLSKIVYLSDDSNLNLIISND